MATYAQAVLFGNPQTGQGDKPVLPLGLGSRMFCLGSRTELMAPRLCLGAINSILDPRRGTFSMSEALMVKPVNLKIGVGPYLTQTQECMFTYVNRTSGLSENAGGWGRRPHATHALKIHRSRIWGLPMRHPWRECDILQENATSCRNATLKASLL
jgi:hypothetical protein